MLTNENFNQRFIIIFSWIIISVGFLFQLSYLFTSTAALAHRPFEEDSFIIMTVTRNIAMGKGLTIDGKTITGGVQPGSFIYIIAHIASGFDKWDALRWARFLNLIGSFFSGYMLYRLSRLILKKEPIAYAHTLSLFSSALWIGSYQVFRINLNGYETVFAMCALLIVLELYLRRWDCDLQKIRFFDIVLGFAMGFSILCRVDLGFLSVGLAGWYFFVNSERYKRKFVSILTWAIISLIITLPWWIFNIWLDGSIMPLSGKATRLQVTFNGHGHSILQSFIRTLDALFEIPFISLYAPYQWGNSIIWLIVRLILLLIIGLLFWKSRKKIASLFSLINWKPIGGLFIFAFLLIIYYIFVHGAWWFMKRYLHPVRTLLFIFSGIYILSLVTVLVNLCKNKILYKIIFSFLSILILCISFFQWFITYNDTDSNMLMPSVTFLRDYYPSARIGAFQSGTLGYFLDNVVNLDGKSNPNAYHAARDDNVINYILNNNIGIISDWPEVVEKYCNYDEFLNYYRPMIQIGNSTIWKRSR